MIPSVMRADRARGLAATRALLKGLCGYMGEPGTPRLLPECGAEMSQVGEMERVKHGYQKRWRCEKGHWLVKIFTEEAVRDAGVLPS